MSWAPLDETPGSARTARAAHRSTAERAELLGLPRALLRAGLVHAAAQDAAGWARRVEDEASRQSVGPSACGRRRGQRLTRALDAACSVVPRAPERCHERDRGRARSGT